MVFVVLQLTFLCGFGVSPVQRPTGNPAVAQSHRHPLATLLRRHTLGHAFIFPLYYFAIARGIALPFLPTCCSFGVALLQSISRLLWRSIPAAQCLPSIWLLIANVLRNLGIQTNPLPLSEFPIFSQCQVAPPHLNPSG